MNNALTRGWVIFLAWGLFMATALTAAPPPPEPLYTHQPGSIDGTGKWFLGREIAHFMTHHGATWLERPERETEERPRILLDALALKPGQTVADVGAGSGYFTWRMAQRVGPTGRVYATDIQREMFRKGVAMGAPIAFGTDSGVYPHGLNARQFAYMVRYGMTPMQAIQSATIRAAELLSKEDMLGSVQPGRFADLVAVKGDPLQNIRVLENLTHVMKDGKLVR